MSNDEVYLYVHCKPFASYPPSHYRVMVDLKNHVVSVYDYVAGHYTTCHSLTPESIQEIINTAST
jgi:hypothetical protein